MIRFGLWRVMIAVAAIAIGGFVILWRMNRPHAETLASVAHAASGDGTKATSGAGPLRVDFVKPHAGGISRTSVLPGSIHAYEAADLYAKVSGYLETQNVDIGDRVKAGQVLAELNSPELHRDVDRYKAAVEKAEAQVGQTRARVMATEADLRAAETGITRAEAGLKRDEAFAKFRTKQFERFGQLVEAKAIDQRLVDEKEEQKLAAESAVDAAFSNLVASKAMVGSAEAKVEQAKADVVDALAEVDLAKANLARAEVFAAYTKIVSPYDGVITLRTYHRGDFVRGADQNAVHPVLTVERTDVVRLVVYIPDSDVPFTNPGDETFTEIDAIPGHRFSGKVSRIAFSEDKKSKTMRTEVDLPNEQGLLRNGMYGKTQLMLQAGNPKAFTVPSTAIVGATKNGKGTVFVVRDGKAQKKTVSLGADNGVLVEIIDGVTADDHVIIANNSSVADGRPVEAHEMTPIESAKK